MAFVTDLPAELQQLIHHAAQVAGILWDRGWAERNAGNISARLGIVGWNPPTESRGKNWPLVRPAVELEGDLLLVSAAGSRMRDLARDPAGSLGIIRITEGGAAVQPVWFGQDEYRPTSELASHVAIHAFLKEQVPAERVVLHTHPNALVALTHNPRFQDADSLNRMLWSMHTEVVVNVPEGAGYIPFVLPGSVELGAATIPALKKHRVVIWQKHGTLAVGPDPHSAFDLVDTLEKAARIWLDCRAAGFDPEGLSPLEVQEIARAFPPPQR